MSYPDSHPGYKDAKSPCDEQPRCCAADVLDDQPMSDPVNHPSHYTHDIIEPIDVIESWGLNFALGNVVKYVCRCDHKGDRLEQLLKAEWYIRREIERERIRRE